MSGGFCEVYESSNADFSIKPEENLIIYFINMYHF